MIPTAIEAHLNFGLLQWMVIIAAAWFFGRPGKMAGRASDDDR